MDRARNRGFWSGIAVTLGLAGIITAAALAIAGAPPESAFAPIPLLAGAYWALTRTSR